MSPELIRIAKFLAAGAVNTVFSYAVYSLLVLAGLPPQGALALGFVIGVTFNYFTTARFVFAQRGLSRVGAYVAGYLVIYVGNALALHLATSNGVGPLAAQAMIIPVTAVATYLAMRRVFATSSP